MQEGISITNIYFDIESVTFPGAPSYGPSGADVLLSQGLHELWRIRLCPLATIR